MNKVQLKKFKTLLTEKREEIVKKAKQTLEEDMTLDANDGDSAGVIGTSVVDLEGRGV